MNMIPVEVAQIIARMLMNFEATDLKSGPVESVESVESFLRSRRSQGRPQSAICSVRICRFICNSPGTRRASGQRAADSSGFAADEKLSRQSEQVPAGWDSSPVIYLNYSLILNMWPQHPWLTILV